MSFLGAIWFLGVCLGHIAFWTRSIGWWYSFPLPRRFLGSLKLAHGVILVLGLVILTRAYLAPSSLAEGLSSSAPVAMATVVYVRACGLIGLICLPLVTIWRLYRRPAALVSNHTTTVDVASRLGYKPLGTGKYRMLAHLPGNEVFRVDFAERTLAVPRLPAAWDGLTILHVSDLHFCGTPDRVFFQQVMDLCAAWEPDLVAITGDLVDSNHHHRWIVPVLGRLRWRVAAFGILGNHDWRRDPVLIRRRLRRAGIRVLANNWEQVEVRGEPLVVVGHEGPWFQPAPDLTDCPEDIFRLCLSHTPDNIRWARQHQVDLMLAGHNHGGQVCLPILGSVFVPSRYGRRYDSGTFHEPPTLLHVSRGLAGKEPLRYNCRPEVAKLVLVRKGEPSH
jgi:predicted MPP superfamily phosphohydrolase